MGSLAYQTAVGGELLEAVGVAYGSGIKAGKILGDEWLDLKKIIAKFSLIISKGKLLLFYSILDKNYIKDEQKVIQSNFVRVD